MAFLIDDNSDLGRFVIARNLGRQYDFLHTAFAVAQATSNFPLDETFIADVNFYGVQFVSTHPGKLRHEVQINVQISETDHQPPRWEDVPELMADFYTKVNVGLVDWDPLTLSAYALWRMNWIHPFVQGNGRTARALSYFLLCKKTNAWLPGTPIIPEGIRANRAEYCSLLNQADKSLDSSGLADLQGIRRFILRLLTEQIESVN